MHVIEPLHVHLCVTEALLLHVLYTRVPIISNRVLFRMGTGQCLVHLTTRFEPIDGLASLTNVAHACWRVGTPCWVGQSEETSK